MTDSSRSERTRRAVGIWVESPARWTNEGITRLLGFLIEGVARRKQFTFHVVLEDKIRDAAEADLISLNARPGSDFKLHSPRDHGVSAPTLRDLADFANAHVPVEAWLSLFPDYAFARFLEAPVTVIFPDAIPKVFPEFGEAAWGPEGVHFRWESNVRALLEHAQGAITFSDHVAAQHLADLFDFPRGEVSVVAHAPPNLRPLLPANAGSNKTEEALRAAGDLLRAEAERRNWHYLRDFPFEEVPYIAISTQDRVTKNVQLAARSLQILLRERRKNLKLLMTAPLHFHQNWTVLPSVVEENLSQFDVVSVPDLPRDVHAAFLYCAAIAVHPSIFEGGHAPFPFYEAASVGTPCLIAKGPHVSELAMSEPEILDYCFEPNDAEGLADRILDVLGRSDEVVGRQKELLGRLGARDWSHVAEAYANAALAAATTKGRPAL